MRKTIPLFFAVFLLAACSVNHEEYNPQQFSFAGKPPIRLNVGEIKLIDTYQPPLVVPNVEQDFPTPPAKAAGQWVHDRLLAAGGQGVLEVTIDQASVREVKLPVEGGLKTLFTDQQSSRLDAQLHVTMRLYTGSDPLAAASGEITVTRSRTMNEKSSVIDRERAFDEMIGEMMADFDGQAEGRLHEYFAGFLL